MQDVSERLQGHYFDLIRRLHVALRPRTYLEVGVHTGKSLELVGPETQIIGIDPTPAVRTRINDNAQLFFETSDDFFATHDVAALLDGQPIDMAFIDGMHLFEYALRDFRNIERWAEPDSVVMVHDCYPLDAASSGRVRDSDTWTGDTWKLVPCLRAAAPRSRDHHGRGQAERAHPDPQPRSQEHGARRALRRSPRPLQRDRVRDDRRSPRRDAEGRDQRLGVDQSAHSGHAVLVRGRRTGRRSALPALVEGAASPGHPPGQARWSARGRQGAGRARAGLNAERSHARMTV